MYKFRRSGVWRGVNNLCVCLWIIPVSIAGEIARLENSGGDRHYDDELLRKVEGMSRIILAQDAEMWLLWLPWPGTAYAVPQYPAVPDFLLLRQVTKKL